MRSRGSAPAQRKRKLGTDDIDLVPSVRDWNGRDIDVGVQPKRGRTSGRSSPDTRTYEVGERVTISSAAIKYRGMRETYGERSGVIIERSEMITYGVKNWHGYHILFDDSDLHGRAWFRAEEISTVDLDENQKQS